MNFKKNNKEYKTTTDNKVFKICHYAHEDMCCMACSKRRKTKDYHIAKYGRLERIRIPNWKLVSKNRKQWMKKPIEIGENSARYSYYTYSKITW